MSWNRYRAGLLGLMFIVSLIGCGLGSNGAKLRIFPGQTVIGCIDSQSNASYA